MIFGSIPRFLGVRNTPGLTFNVVKLIPYRSFMTLEVIEGHVHSYLQRSRIYQGHDESYLRGKFLYESYSALSSWRTSSGMTYSLMSHNIWQPPYRWLELQSSRVTWISRVSLSSGVGWSSGVCWSFRVIWSSNLLQSSGALTYSGVLELPTYSGYPSYSGALTYSNLLQTSNLLQSSGAPITCMEAVIYYDSSGCRSDLNLSFRG